jgi:plastocyanin
MVRRVRTLLVVAGLLGLTLAIAPGVAAGDPCYHGYTIPPTTSAETTNVELEPCAFVPTIAHVAPGSTVTFANVSDLPHLITGANSTWGDRDAELVRGASRTVTFEQPGIYAYACAIHRGMTGVIVVEDPDAAEVAAAATVTGSTPGTDQAVLLAMSGLAGLAALGWTVALLQRRRVPQLQEPQIAARG